MSNAEMVMSVTLEAAVPLWQADLCRLPFAEVQRIAHESADVVASRGDVLQFGGRKGEAANAFNALARGIAAASMCPGGIVFLGVRWEHHHPEAPVNDPVPCIACDKDCERGDLHNACSAVVDLMLREPRPGDAEYIAACAQVSRRRWLDGSGGEQHFEDGTLNPAFVAGHTMYVGPDVIARVRAEMRTAR